jgi:hypothetical protein
LFYHRDPKYLRRLPWNQAYKWDPTYVRPLRALDIQEPWAAIYRFIWRQKRIVLEKTIRMSPLFQEERFNKLIHRDLYWNKKRKRFLRIQPVKRPRPAPIPIPNPKQHIMDQFLRQLGLPVPERKILRFREDDDEEEKYNKIYNSKKDGIPPPREEPEKTIQDIEDDFFTNAKNKTYDGGQSRNDLYSYYSTAPLSIPL